MIPPGSAVLGAFLAFLGAPTQDEHPSQDRPDAKAPSPRLVEWREGEPIRIRVPVATPEREVMTTVAFPEDRIETAITGWAAGAVTATARRGLLFLRLPRMAEGHVNVIGGSGTHYLLHLEGVEKPDPAACDAYVKVMRAKGQDLTADALPARKARPRPVGSLELVQAMRLGLNPEGATIVRAGREVAYKSPEIEIRLLWVYKHGSYVGRIYEIENLTADRQPLDASRFRAREERLIVSGLRENVLAPRATTRLYTVFWKD